jgi:GNAT superfamily N-acetyltransferase
MVSNTLSIYPIRRAVKEDTSLLVDLSAKTFYDTFSGTCTVKDMDAVMQQFFNSKQVNLELNDPNDYYYLTFSPNSLNVLGYSRLKYSSKCPLIGFEKYNAIELKRLYILKDYHGKGVAKSLMEFNIELAKSLGYNLLYLSVWEYNYRAREFYHKMGFKNSLQPNDFPLGNTPQTDIWFTLQL